MENYFKSRVSDRALSFPISSIRRVEGYAKGLTDVIRLNIGQPDRVTPEHIREAAKRAIDEGFTRYTSVLGIPELRMAIAEKLERENDVEVNWESEVLVTAGAQAALFSTIYALVNPGEEVILQGPSYPVYETAVRLAGGKVVYVPQREELNFSIDPEDVEKAVTPRTKLLIIISPNNPTGSVIDKSRLEAIAETVAKNDLLVISDEIYEKFVYDDTRFNSISSFPDMKEKTIIVNSFSKTYAMTGWRVGYVAADRFLIDHIKKVHHSVNICASSISQRAALAALTGPQKCVKEMVQEYDSRRRKIVEGLNEIEGVKCLMPRGAFYVFPNVKEFNRTSEEVAIYLAREAKVLTVPGSGFGNYGEGYLRLSYGLGYKQEAVDRIKTAMEKLIQS